MKVRTTFFVLNTFLLLCSILTGLKVIPGPDLLGAALAFYALFILPGFLISRFLKLEDDFSFFSLLRYFLVGLVSSTIFALSVALPIITFRTASIVYAVLILILLILYSARGARTNDLNLPQSDDSNQRRKERIILFLITIFVFATLFVFFNGSGEIGWYSDSLDHVSFVRRSIESNTPFPMDSFYKEGDGAAFDPRKGLWHAVLALWAYQGEIEPHLLWAAIPSFLSFLTLCSFLFFAIELTGSLFTALFAAVLFVLFARGSGVGWLTKLGYSRNISMILIWVNTALLISYYRDVKTRNLIGASIISLIGVSFHVVYALVQFAILLGFIVFSLVSPSARGWRRRILLSIPAQAGGSLLPLIVRFVYTNAPANIIHVHKQGLLMLGRRFVVIDPVYLVNQFGLIFLFALLLALIFFKVAWKAERRSLVGTLFLVPVALALVPIFSTPIEDVLGYLYFRVLNAAPMFCFLAMGISGLVVYIATGKAGHEEDLPGVKNSGNKSASAKKRFFNLVYRLIALAFLILIVLYPSRFALSEARMDVKRILSGCNREESSYKELFAFLNRNLDKHSVIASDPVTSYIISAYTDHFVTVVLDQHCSPVDSMALERVLRTRTLFSPSHSLKESIKWLEGENVDYILLNMNLAETDFFSTFLPAEAYLSFEKFNACSYLREVYRKNGFVLYSIDYDKPGRGQAQCDTVILPPLHCKEDIYSESEKSDTSGGRIKVRLSSFSAGDSSASADFRENINIGFSYGLVLKSFEMKAPAFRAGDTITVTLCWIATREIEPGLPIEAVLRFDTDYPKGDFYRHWYGKQYRRIIERSRGNFYRFTWRVRLMSGTSFPDEWKPGETLREDIIIPISPWLAEGEYSVRLNIDRLSYLPKRTLADYFLDEDSVYGKEITRVRILGAAN